MFLAFQYPQEIAGVSVIQFLRQALSARKGIDLSVLELRLAIMDWMKRLDMDPAFADRYLNEGFSGGEKKRNEVLQMAILEPELAVLDETDSGLDIDALKVVAHGVQEVRSDRPSLGVVLITHYRRLLDYLEPDRVHILVDGRVVDSGGPELAERLDVGQEALERLDRDADLPRPAALGAGRARDLQLGNVAAGLLDEPDDLGLDPGEVLDDHGNILGKGSHAHAAAVVGDTVGDPLKDTAGPSLHVMVKLLSTITLVLAALFI
jgi:ABC-type multidrug transport system ATPase subunit